MAINPIKIINKKLLNIPPKKVVELIINKIATSNSKIGREVKERPCDKKSQGFLLRNSEYVKIKSNILTIKNPIFIKIL